MNFHQKALKHLEAAQIENEQIIILDIEEGEIAASSFVTDSSQIAGRADRYLDLVR